MRSEHLNCVAIVKMNWNTTKSKGTRKRFLFREKTFKESNQTVLLTRDFNILSNFREITHHFSKKSTHRHSAACTVIKSGDS
jgi:hypothetical protein